MTRRPTTPSARFAARCPSSTPSEPAAPPRRRVLAAIAGLTGLAALVAACGREPGRPWKDSLFPEFALPSLDGETHRSGQYLGRPLLVNFWATWCPPCRREMADLDALHRRMSPRGLTLLAISVDTDRNLVREYVRREGFGFTVLIDAGQQWSLPALAVPGFPTTYLVGADGRILEAWIGPRAWAEPSFQAEVAARAGLT